MPDISMCSDEDCPIRETCYRYKAEPSFMQYYAGFRYEEGCEYYIKLENDGESNTNT